MRKGARFHCPSFRAESEFRLAFKKIKSRRHRGGVRRKFVPGGEPEQDHLYVGIVIKCPAGIPRCGISISLMISGVKKWFASMEWLPSCSKLALIECPLGKWNLQEFVHNGQ